MPTTQTFDRELAVEVSQDKIDLWRDKPARMVWDLFDVSPDPWQARALYLYPRVPRLAMQSCTGPGKTCVLAWIAWNFLLTRWHPTIGACSVTGPNLKAGLKTEMARWYARSELLQAAFEITGDGIYSKNHPRTWKLEFRSWAKDANEDQIGQALAGLHAQYVMWLVDESGGIPRGIMPVLEAIFSGNPIEAHLIQAGNPLSLVGLLYQASVRAADLWEVIRVTADPKDPNRTPRVSLQHAEEQIKQWGEDNPYVQVRIFGQFPPAEFNALIGPEEVQASMNRMYREMDFKDDPKILGVDVARFGLACFDDATEILTSEGWKLFPDLDGREMVLSRNGNTISWEPIEKIHSYDFDGEMNLLELRHINFCITDNHRFLVKTTPKSDRYKLEEYRRLPQEFVIPSKGAWAGVSPEKITFAAQLEMPHGGLRRKEWTFDYVDWASFLGWFVSEGNVYREKRRNGRLRICIAQNPGAKMSQIKALLDRMGLKWRMTGNGRQLEVSNNQIGQYLILNCGVGAMNKRVPYEISNGSDAVIRAFLHTLALGDGHFKNGRARSYATSSRQLANNVQEMLAKIGEAGQIVMKKTAGTEFFIEGRRVVRKSDMYTVYRTQVSQFGKGVKKRQVRRILYRGKVWCVSTRYGTICVRRKGVPMWSGNSSVCTKRQGLQMFKPDQWRGLTSIPGAGQVARIWQDWNADACFIDNTGGFGAGWVDQLMNLRFSPIGVNFSEKPIQIDRYANKRTEMAFLLIEWIKRAGALPNVPELESALVQTTYTFTAKGLMLLEPKEMVEKKIGFSPDHMDSSMLTFAYPVSKRAAPGLRHGGNPNRPWRHKVEYDLFQEFDKL